MTDWESFFAKPAGGASRSLSSMTNISLAPRPSAAQFFAAAPGAITRDPSTLTYIHLAAVPSVAEFFAAPVGAVGVPLAGVSQVPYVVGVPSYVAPVAFPTPAPTVPVAAAAPAVITRAITATPSTLKVATPTVKEFFATPKPFAVEEVVAQKADVRPVVSIPQSAVKILSGMAPEVTPGFLQTATSEQLATYFGTPVPGVAKVPVTVSPYGIEWLPTGVEGEVAAAKLWEPTDILLRPWQPSPTTIIVSEQTLAAQRTFRATEAAFPGMESDKIEQLARYSIWYDIVPSQVSAVLALAGVNVNKATLGELQTVSPVLKTIATQLGVKLGILQASSVVSPIDTLRQPVNLAAELRSYIMEKYPGKFDVTTYDFLEANYPEALLNLAAGKITPENIGWLISRHESVRASNYMFHSGPVGNSLEIAHYIRDMIICGCSNNMVAAALSELRSGMSADIAKDFDSWVKTGGMDSDLGIAGLVSADISVIGAALKSEKYQVQLTAGTTLASAAAGFMLLGTAGLISGAIFGIFAGDDLSQTLSMGVIAQEKVAKLMAAGIVAPQQTLDDYKKRIDGFQKDYNTALLSGQLDQADKALRSMLQVCNDYAGWIEDNKWAFVQAGLFSDLRTDILNMDNQATGRLLVSEAPLHWGSAASPPGWVEGTTKVYIIDAKGNEYALSGYKGGEIKLPPGTWVLELKDSTGVRKIWEGTVSSEGGTFGGWFAPGETRGVTSTLIPTSAATNRPMTIDEYASAQKIGAITDLTNGVRIPIYLPPGWTVKQPGQEGWATSDYVTLFSKDPTSVEFKDSEGRIHYTRFSLTDVDYPHQIIATESMPLTDVQKQAAYEASNVAVKPYGSGVLVGTWPTTGRLLWDGHEIIKDLPAVYQGAGQHILAWEKPDGTYVTRTVFIEAGETVTVPIYFYEEPTQAAYPSGGGGGGGEGYAAAAQPTTGLIVFGNTFTGATIWLDGVQSAPVIGQAYSISPGYHAIKATKTGYNTFEKTVYVIEGQTLNVDAAFITAPAGTGGGVTEPTETTVTASKGYVVFTDQVIGAEVFLDGNAITVTPGVNIPVNYGYHGVLIRKTGYDDWVKNVYLAAGDLLTISPIFTQPGSTTDTGSTTPTATSKRVYFNSTPSGSKILLGNCLPLPTGISHDLAGLLAASISTGFTGEWTPSYLELEKGLYLIVIQKTGYNDEKHIVYVSEYIAFDALAVSLAQNAGWL